MSAALQMTRADLARAAYVARDDYPCPLLDRALDLLVAINAACEQSASLAQDVRSGRNIPGALRQHDAVLDGLRQAWGAWGPRIVASWQQKKLAPPHVIELAELAAEELRRAIDEMRADMRAACTPQPLVPEPFDMSAMLA